MKIRKVVKDSCADPVPVRDIGKTRGSERERGMASCSGE